MASPVSVPLKAVARPTAGAQNIYVSSTEGDDARDGLSPATAVKTLARAESLVRDRSGDWLLFKRGDVWGEGLDQWRKRGRSPDEPLVLSTYGTGPAPCLAMAPLVFEAVHPPHLTILGIQFNAAAASAGAHPRTTGHPRLAPFADPAWRPPIPRPRPWDPKTSAFHVERPVKNGKSARSAARSADGPVAADPIPLRQMVNRPELPPAAPGRLPRLAEPLPPLLERLGDSHADSLAVRKVRPGPDDESFSVTFSADVSAGLKRGDLLLTSTDGQSIDPETMAVAWDARTLTATWTFPGQPGRVLPAGRWHLRLRGYITDRQGRQLDGARDGLGGEDFVCPLAHVSRGAPAAPCARIHVESYERRAA